MLFFKKKDEDISIEEFVDVLIGTKKKQLSIRKKSIFHAIDLISNTLGLLEYRTYKPKDEANKFVKEELYYKLNIKPNSNDSAFELWKKAYTKLLINSKVLIFSLNNKLYVADSYDVTDDVLKDRKYSNITIKKPDGTVYELYKTIKNEDAIELRYSDKKIIKYINDFYSEYSSFIDIAKSVYSAINNKKWRITLPGNQPAIKDPQTQEPISYDKFKQKLISALYNDEERAFFLSETFKLECVNGLEKVVNSEDYLNLLKNWDKETAKIFNIPEDIFFGTKEVNNSIFNNYITFSCLPYIKLVQDNLNTKLFNMEDYLKGNKIVVNKNGIKYHDIIDSANNIDKLYADGFSHDDILEILGEEPLNEEWSQEHRITKNYSEDVSNKLKGGDEIE